MKEIKFDTGIKTYQINDSGVLKFNPSDPNLYKRFKDLRVEIEQIQKDYNERSKSAETGEDAIDLLAEYDARVKKSLAHVFGEENDFDSILSGANVMAVASNGELVITNFLDAMRLIHAYTSIIQCLYFIHASFSFACSRKVV